MNNKKDFLNRGVKEDLLKQKAKVIWFTGLPCSGKSTLALNLERILFENHITAVILDGDLIRNGINKDLGFSINSRTENIRRVSEISKLLVNNGIVVIVSLVSPLNELRMLAKEIIGEKDYIEIFLNARLSTCEERDVKGMYKKARLGQIKDFTGVDATYEKPEKPFLEIITDECSIEESLEKLTERLFPLLKL